MNLCGETTRAEKHLILIIVDISAPMVYPLTGKHEYTCFYFV